MTLIKNLELSLKEALLPFQPAVVESAFFIGQAVSPDFRPTREFPALAGLFLTEASAGNIRQLLDLSRKFRKENLFFPYVLTEEFIQNSLDTFPLEFIELRRFHKMIIGESPFTNHIPELGNVRLQCERELKGKSLHLKSALLATANDKELAELILASRTDFMRIYLGLLTLKGDCIPLATSQVASRVAEVYSLDKNVLTQVANGIIPSKELFRFYELYLEQIDKLSKIVDEGVS